MSPNVELKTMPNDLGSVGDGATPMWFGEKTMKPYSKGKIISVLDAERDLKNPLRNPDFIRHQAGTWECFDRAYLGVSIVRCQCPGASVGVAYGDALEGGVALLKDPRHAIIYYWHMENGKWTPALYDPLYGPINSFKPKAFISFPIHRPNSPVHAEPKKLQPFDTMVTNDIGTIMMYNNFDVDPGYDVTNFNNIQNYLKNKGYKQCLPPAGEIEKEIFDNKRTREDRAFWVFNQVRGKFKRAAVGFAWGTKTKETDKKKKDSAVLVLWKNDMEFVLWDVEDAKVIEKEDFKATFLMG